MPHHPARPSRRPSPCNRTATVTAVVLATVLAGCGGDDPSPSAGARTTTAAPPTATTPTATGPVNGTVLAPATSTTTSPTDGTRTVTALTGDPTIARGTDDRRGIMIAIEAAGSLNAAEARGVVTVTGDAPLAVRRRLARSAGFFLACDVAGRPSQGVPVDTTGSRTATPVGTRRTTLEFLEPAKGGTLRDGLRSCSIQLAPQKRGSNRRSYASDQPETAFVTVRFR